MNISLYINLFTSAALSIVGILLISGVIPNLDIKSRLIFGIILLAYGIYRFLTVQTKLKMNKIEKDREEIRKATEEIINKQK